MVTLKKLNAVNTFDDLSELNIGRVYCDISHRGGGIGFYSKDVAAHFNVPVEYLPNKFGAGCNYMGGGVRGSIFPSTFDKAIVGRKANLLNALANACVRVYQDIENESEMNEELDCEGEINWDSMATKAVRNAGITSAY